MYCGDVASVSGASLASIMRCTAICAVASSCNDRFAGFSAYRLSNATLDVTRVSVVALNQVRVIAVH